MAKTEKSSDTYPATLEIDYSKKSNRVTTLFRLVISIPVIALVSILTSSTSEINTDEAGKVMATNSGGVVGALFAVTALTILFRQRYPKWWFDFNLELNRFTTRVGAYVFLLTDKYPSTEDEQSVHLNIVYPDAKKDLNRWLPLVKWLLAFPHYFVLGFFVIGSVFATIFAWFAILFTGTYPKSIFDFMVGVGRYSLRITAYTTLLTTDKYPPFSLK